MHQLFYAPGCCWRFLTRCAWQHAAMLHQTLRALVGAAATRGCPHLRRTTAAIRKQASTSSPSTIQLGMMACVSGHGVPR